MVWTLFEYRYRDAGNFKANGTVVLHGAADGAFVDAALGKLEGGEFFIAEQLGVPPLYEGLYQWSGGPIADDHCWHEFVSIRQVDETPPESIPRGGQADAFFKRLADTREWRGELSPHWAIG